MPCTQALVTKFNPTAKLVEATMGRVDPKEILGTGLFDMNTAAQHPEWLKEARIGEYRGVRTSKCLRRGRRERVDPTAHITTHRRAHARN